MGIKALENIPEHIIDHAALGVKSQAQNDNRYVTLTTNQEIDGEKQFNQNTSLKAEKRLIFDAS